jgi:hypothetical protein
MQLPLAPPDAIKDAENVERADAQFMLVACSAFVNYLFTR